MKKLMIAVAFVCTAVALNAAVVKWNETNIYGESGESLITAAGGYNIYLFTSEAVALDSWSEQTFGSNIAKGYSMGLTGDGKAQNTVDGIQHTEINAASSLNLATDTLLTFYTVAVNGDESKYYISNTKEMTLSGTATESTLLAFLSQAGATQGKTDAWQSAPEPTSGLLVLMGLAGLMLRRKRA